MSLVRVSFMVGVLALAGCGGAQVLSTFERVSSPPTAVRQEFVTVTGGELELWCGGDGPTVMFLSGIGGDHSLKGFGVRLTDQAYACFYDRPGDGPPPPDKPRTAGSDAADLHELLAVAEIPTPVVLVAHSYGGLIAVIAAGAGALLGLSELLLLLLAQLALEVALLARQAGLHFGGQRHARQVLGRLLDLDSPFCALVGIDLLLQRPLDLAKLRDAQNLARHFATNRAPIRVRSAGLSGSIFVDLVHEVAVWALPAIERRDDPLAHLFERLHSEPAVAAAELHTRIIA